MAAVAALWIAALAAAPGAAAATYYVAPGGSDLSDGSEASPFGTIQRAADAVNPGDIVILRDGTYVGNGETIVRLDRSGTADQWITFRAENEWGAVLDGQDFTTAHGVSLSDGVGYLRFEGLQVQRTLASGFAAGNETHDIYYYRNLLHDIGRICSDAMGDYVGFRDKRTSVRMVYDSNVLHTIGRLHLSPGCVPFTTHYQNHDDGMSLHGHGIKIINNVFSDFRSGWAIQSSGGASDWLIANNTFAFPNPNREGQIVLWQDNTNFTIANNIFYQPAGAAIVLAPCSNKTNVIVRNNISTADMILDNDTGRNRCQSLQLASNRVSTDPRMIDPERLNFRLTNGSLALDAGEASLSPVVDHDGAPRPQGKGYDIGAFEFGDGAADTSAPLVTISSPAAGETVSGEVNIAAAATDDVAVLGVQVRVNDDALGPEGAVSNYTMSWDTTKVPNGLYVLTVMARDAAGNVGTTAVTIFVHNREDADRLRSHPIRSRTRAGDGQ
ncbi:MAG: Ig-like domain-containing protein [Bryobacterales bacterium]